MEPDPIVFDFVHGETYRQGEHPERTRQRSNIVRKTVEGIPAPGVTRRERKPWSRIAWYWLGVVLGTALGLCLGYLLAIGVLPV